MDCNESVLSVRTNLSGTSSRVDPHVSGPIVCDKVSVYSVFAFGGGRGGIVSPD